jgi:hypothetical protein
MSPKMRGGEGSTPPPGDPYGLGATTDALITELGSLERRAQRLRDELAMRGLVYVPRRSDDTINWTRIVALYPGRTSGELGKLTRLSGGQRAACALRLAVMRGQVRREGIAGRRGREGYRYFPIEETAE